MSPVALDAGGYDGTYKLVGGEPALDLVNTISWPGTAREHDWLDRGSNLTAWAAAAGLIGAETRRRLDALPPATIRTDLVQVRRIRGLLARVLTPLAHGGRPAPEEIEELNDLAQKACRRRRIGSRSLAWEWETPKRLPEVLAPVVWSGAQLVTSGDHSRLGYCPGCEWLFVDATRNHSRRWCDMDDCGSRDKALRYYHRTAQHSRT